MRLLVLTCLLLLAYGTQANGQITAGDLESDCKLAADGDPDGSLCLMIVDGFVYGYMVGVDRGVNFALANDQTNAPDTSRVTRIARSALCLPEEGSTKQIVQVFATYLASHPERRSDRYALVLRDSVESHFCAGRQA